MWLYSSTWLPVTPVCNAWPRSSHAVPPYNLQRQTGSLLLHLGGDWEVWREDGRKPRIYQERQ